MHLRIKLVIFSCSVVFNKELTCANLKTIHLALIFPAWKLLIFMAFRCQDYRQTYYMEGKKLNARIKAQTNRTRRRI